MSSQPKLLLPTGHLDRCTWPAELPPLLFAAQSSDRPLPSPVNDLSTNNDSTINTLFSLPDYVISLLAHCHRLSASLLIPNQASCQISVSICLTTACLRCIDHLTR